MFTCLLLLLPSSNFKQRHWLPICNKLLLITHFSVKLNFFTLLTNPLRSIASLCHYLSPPYHFPIQNNATLRLHCLVYKHWRKMTIFYECNDITNTTSRHPETHPVIQDTAQDWRLPFHHEEQHALYDVLLMVYVICN